MSAELTTRKWAAVIATLVAFSTPILSAQTLREAIAKDYDAHLDSLFKHFHANPELSMQEAATSDRLASEIEGAGFQVTRNIGKTGFVGIMKNSAGPVRPAVDSDLWILNLDSGETSPWLASEQFIEEDATFSPDGEIVAYSSNESEANSR